MIRTRKNSEHGAVLVLSTLFLFVLLLIAALAIESSYIQSAITQIRNHTRIASLTAIKEYFKALETEVADDGCKSDSVDFDVHRCAMEKARDRVITLSAENQILANKGKTPQILIYGDPPTAAGEKAILRAGWWITQQEICTENTEIGCEGVTKTPPYFFPYDGSLRLDQFTLQPNAFQVSGEFYPEGLVSLFSRFLVGYQTLKVPTEAISTFVPRHIMFALDLSPTVAADTHLKWTSFGPFRNEDPNEPLPGCCPTLQEGHGNYFAFGLIKDNCNRVNFVVDGLRFALGDNPEPATGTCYGGLNSPYSVYFPSMDMSFDELSWQNGTEWRYRMPRIASEFKTKVRDVRIVSQTHHYASDYKRRSVIGETDYNSLSLSDINLRDFHPQLDQDTDPGRTDLGFSDITKQFYRIDYYRDANYSGPQPYTLVIKSIRDAICAFREKRVPGDMLGILGFDDSTDARRIIKLDPDNLDYLVGDCGDPDSDLIGLLDIEYFQTLNDQPLPDEEYSVPSSLGKGFDRLIKLGLFPQRLKYTDIKGGLIAAFNELIIAQRRTAIPAARSIVLVTDGVSNCPMHNDHVNCRNFLEDFELASEQLLEMVDTSIRGNDTSLPYSPIHVIAFGQAVGPHVRSAIRNPNMPSDSGKAIPPSNGGLGSRTYSCLTDEEFRDLQSSNWLNDQNVGLYVVPNSSENKLQAWIDMNSGEYLTGGEAFHTAMVPLYKIAAATGGVFAPLTIWDSNVDNACSTIIDQARAAGFEDDVHFKTFNGKTYLNPDTVEPLCMPVPIRALGSKYYDIRSGRLMVDQYCRRPDAQMRDTLEKIMGGNPYKVVSVGGDTVEN